MWRAAVILLQVGVILCCRWVFNTDTANTTGAWREEFSRDAHPASFHSTTGDLNFFLNQINPVPINPASVRHALLQASTSTQDCSCLIRPELFPHLLVEHQTLPPSAALHCELQAGKRNISAADCAFSRWPSASDACACNKASVGWPVSL